MAFSRRIGSLRREYFLNKEAVAPLLLGKDDFCFFVYGHRLSSLYRGAILARKWLMKPFSASLFVKYSNPENSTQKDC